jgi:hypothetical protein
LCSFIFFSMPIVLPASLVFFDLNIWPTFGEHTNCKDYFHAVIFWIFSSAHCFKYCNSMRIGPLMWETKFDTHVHVSFKMFPESFYFCEKQNTTIIYATFPSKLSPCDVIHFCQRLWKCWKHSCKSFCESLFSFSVAFLMISLASRNTVRSMAASVKRFLRSNFQILHSRQVVLSQFDSGKITNKLQPCNRIYYSTVH